jgi:branched-chain amino acid transport system permease protein
MSMTLYATQQLINALSIGSLYALMAVGLAMVFGILRQINFAHGDLMMIAAYIGAFALIAKLPLGIALLLSIIGTVIVGVLMERVAYRPIRNAPAVAALLTSFAVGQILENGTLLTTRLAGKPIQIAFPRIDFISGILPLAQFGISEQLRIPKLNAVSLVVGLVLLLLLTLFINRTTLGLSMRAAAEDLQAAQLMGIDTNRVIVTAFVLGSALASVAGILYAAQAGTINPVMGFTPVLKAFIAAVIGGFGSIAGAVVGGYTLGILEVLLTALPGLGDILPAASTAPQVIEFFKTYLPSSLTSYRDAFVFIILILILLVRPGGILGASEERIR